MSLKERRRVGDKFQYMRVPCRVSRAVGYLVYEAARCSDVDWLLHKGSGCQLPLSETQHIQFQRLFTGYIALRMIANLTLSIPQSSRSL